MKKILVSILLIKLAFANVLVFENNTSLVSEKNLTNQKKLTKIEINTTDVNISNENNYSEYNLSINKKQNISELNYSKINNEINETNTSNHINIDLNFSQEKNNSKVETVTEEFNTSFKTLNPHIDIAIVFKKNILNRYKKNIINSINAYLLYKNVDFNIKVFNNIQDASNYYENILYFTTDANLSMLKEYPNNFFFPIIFNPSEKSDNLFFAGLNFKNQIDKLIAFMKEKKAIIINSNTIMAKKLTLIETNSTNATIMSDNNINYKELNQSYIFFNTPSNKTAQILSNINYQNIETNLQFSSQINYDPLLIKLTQPQDVEKLLIANSLINIPLTLDSYNELFNTNIRFNWLNYTTSLLLNKIYNISSNGEEFFLNDFKMNIFNNQVEYKTKIYQIIDNSFREVY